ncbi:MAG: hypothetical protein IDH49_07885 [Gammaproteobacteria bacterium]|nr:hypothetical protein [Gammaproteobacteria bacterium]
MKNTWARVKSSIVTGILSASLVACGGGDNPDNPASGSAGPTATYLFYQDSSAGGVISAVDPADPAHPIIPVETSAASEATFAYHGTYDAATQITSSFHPRTLIYAKDGKLWKINALKGSTLSPVQLSNETTANLLCHTTTNEDFANHNNAVFFYSLPGPDGSCFTSDDISKMVRVGMSASDAPFNLGSIQRITSINDSQTGAIEGWLATDGNNLNSYDANFANPSMKATFTTGPSLFIFGGTTAVFLRIDDKLRVYNPETGRLSPSRHTFSPGLTIRSSGRDGSNIFFIDGNTIYKMPTEGNDPATQLVSESDAEVCGDLHSIEDKLVYSCSNQTITTIKSVPKTGGASQLLVAGSSEETLQIRHADRHWVYYNHLSGNSRRVAGAIKNDNTGGKRIGNAMWVGAAFSSSGNVATRATLRIRLILAENYNLTSGFGGGTLKSYDALTNTPITTIGTIPSDISEVSLRRYVPGGTLLAVGYPEGRIEDADIFLINTETQNSLRRITNTPAIREYPLL